MGTVIDKDIVSARQQGKLKNISKSQKVLETLATTFAVESTERKAYLQRVLISHVRVILYNIDLRKTVDSQVNVFYMQKFLLFLNREAEVQNSMLSALTIKELQKWQSLVEFVEKQLTTLQYQELFLAETLKEFYPITA